VDRDGRGGYRPNGSRLDLSASCAFASLKLKPKLSLTITISGGSAERIRWGHWGEAVMFEFSYMHRRNGADVESARPSACLGRDLKREDRPAQGARVLGRPHDRRGRSPSSPAFLTTAPG
jgi:hypothetical protein